MRLRRRRLTQISIHAPREGSDPDTAKVFAFAFTFLSTLPARGATCSMRWLPRLRYWNFYPRSPRGERPWQVNVYEPTGLNFYPRSPRGERPAATLRGRTIYVQFLSTLPARGATNATFCTVRSFSFLSTLPARGATTRFSARAPSPTDFYPRSPRGERLKHPAHREVLSLISIHAPREGSDLLAFKIFEVSDNFYPRSPRGERPDS